MNKSTAHIATNIKQLRQASRMTQSDIAKKAGINVNYYAKLERGESTPSLKMLEKVVKALGVHSSEVLPF